MPETTVAAIVTATIDGQEHILLTRRAGNPFKGQWCLPGGHIEPYEHARDAMIREVKEETGLDFAPTFFRYFDEIIPERDIHAVVLVFAGAGIGELRAEPDEVTEIGWFALDTARSMPLAFTHNEILDAYAA